MVIDWKEREHEREDELAMEDEVCMDALTNCGLKKFFLTPYLRAQPELLQDLINIWDENEQVLGLRDQVLELEVSDIYFITGLSRRGLVPILTGSRPSGKEMGEVMARVCPGAQFVSGSAKVDISTIRDLTLKVVLFTILRVAGLQTPREVTKKQLLLASECMNPTIFDWAIAVTTNMKRQLMKCKKGKLKQFGYNSILVSFILE